MINTKIETSAKPASGFKSWILGLLLLGTACPVGANPNCNEVVLADVGWTDVSATTAIAASLLTERGYKPKIILLSLPVTLASLKNGDVDVFLGNWMPSQKADLEPFLKDSSITVLSKNLSGAKYTLAVPKYTYDAGLHSFEDIHKFKKELRAKIYGIESGNEGNRAILQMIKTNDFGLTDFSLIESSEQGMLLSVQRAYLRKEHVVFLGWAPHPMNIKMQLEYLPGGDKYFGAKLGDASVYTLTRKGFSSECPQLAGFLRELTFTVKQENEIMQLILDEGLSPQQASERWLTLNPQAKEQWLAHLEQEALPKVQASLRNASKEASLSLHDLSSALSTSIDNLNRLLASLPVLLFVIAFALILFLVHRSVFLSLGVSLGFAAIFLLGLWEQTIQTLTLVFLSIFVSSMVGIPIGIWLAKHPRLNRFTDPILNMMQTVPTFVYLIPTLLLFGLGVVPGLISTVIFAVVAPIRLTRLGIQSVPKEILEVADAFGATKWQKLFSVELKSAMPLILEGINQCVMLSLSMVVIAALVGADGLGAPVIRALNTVDLAGGAKAGAAIVILAAILDKSLRRGKSATH